MGTKQTTLTTLNKALNLALVEPSDNKEAEPQLPEWLEIVPAGDFEGRDGRQFSNHSPETVIDWIVSNKKDIQIDVNHATQLKAPYGDDAPAHGWIKALASEFDIRGGAVWGRIEWNYSGKWLLENKDYRYYSPAFTVRDDGEVIGVVSLGLTNDPNLFLSALNSQQTPKDTLMDLAQLRAELGLDDSATMADCITALNKMKTDHQLALNNKQPNMLEFAPRSEVTTALNRVAILETKIAAQATAKLDDEIETSLNKALLDAKITPADRDYYETQCRKEGGLDEFNALMAAKPDGKDSGIDFNNREIPATTTALNTDQKYAADALGIPHADYLKTLKEER